MSYPPQSYSDHFEVGRQGESAMSSLNKDAAKWQATGYRPSSVLSQVMPSPNAMSQRDAQRQILGGMLPTANGASENTFEAETPLKLQGGS